jgi:exopolysaccharide production protein ExoQ
MMGLSISRQRLMGRKATAAVLACLAATVAVSALATSIGALPLVVLAAFGVVAVVVALQRPMLLFYLYCAAIPFNFALPPGPAGTVARIAGIAFFVGYLVRRPDALRPRVIPIFGWAFVGWTLASCLWAGNPQTAFDAWVSLAQLFAISVLVASLVEVNAGVIRFAFWAYALSAAVTAAIGSISYLQSPVIYLARAAAFSAQDPAMFASIILPAILILMFEIQSRTNSPAVRLCALAALIVCVAGLALSGTRSGWIGVIAAAIVWLLLQRDRRQVLSLAALALGVSILVVAVPGMGAFLFGRADTSISTGGSGRTDIWAVGLYMLTTAPLLGVGFGNFHLAYTPYVVQQASAGLAPIYALSAGRAPHNIFLGTFVETGVVGGVLLILFFASALRQPGGGRLANVVTAILVGLFVQSFFLDILQQKQLWLFLAIALGLSAAARNAVDASRSTTAADVVAER